MAITFDVLVNLDRHIDGVFFLIVKNVDVEIYVTIQQNMLLKILTQKK